MAFAGITFGYSRRAPPVVAELDIQLGRGRTTAILGPNGAGKTTLVALALGWLTPWRGEVTLAGRPLPAFSRRELGRLMALVPQGEHIPFEYSVLEYVLLGRAPHLPSLAMPTEDDDAAAAAALRTAGIADLAHRSLLALSGGERQLVLLARALAQQPSLLLLDEPTAHLDLRNKTRLIGVIRDLKRHGVTIVMTSHEPEVVLAVADDVVLMGPGHVLAAGTLDAVLTADNLSRAYGIPVRIASLDGRPQILWT